MSKKLAILLALLGLNVMYVISFFIPKKKNLWVFGAWFGDKYADNPRYLFEYVIKNRPDIQAVWLTDSKQVFTRLRSQGYDVRYKKSIRGYWAAVRSRYQIICCGLNDVFLYGYHLARPKVIQLWHGIPIKKVLMNDDAFRKEHTSFSYKIKTFLFPGTRFFFHTTLASSNHVYHLYLNETFKGLSKNLLKIGQARNDVLIRHRTNRTPIKKILYAPTHRHEKSGTDSGFFAYQMALPSHEELRKIDNICAQYHYEFIIRLHPYAEKYMDFLELDSYQCIKQSITEDINQDLIESKLLITDISSSIFDYALLDRTLLICFPDIESYKTNNRDLYYKPETLIDHKFLCYDWKTCTKVLEKMLITGDFPKNTDKIAEKYNSYSLSGESCKRIVNNLAQE